MKKHFILIAFCFTCFLTTSTNLYSFQTNCEVLLLPCVNGPGNEIFCVNLGGNTGADCVCGAGGIRCEDNGEQ